MSLSAAAAPELLRLAPEELARRIVALLGVDGARHAVEARDVRRAFGGNARRAWSFQATWSTSEGTRVTVEAIMLSQAERGQVEASLTDEYALLRALEGSRARAPRTLALDRDGAVIGAPSIVLERIPGQASAAHLLRDCEPALAGELVGQLAEAAAALHTAHLGAPGGGEDDLGAVLGLTGASAHSHAAAVLDHWEAQLREARLEPEPVLSALYGWLREHLPEPPRLSVVHGDLRVGNFLYEQDCLTGVLDWEMAHLGDPIEDVAWIYRSFWSPERLLPLEQFVARYERSGGPAVDSAHLRFYRIFTEVKFATISLRASRAFARGTTRNLRLADRAATVTDSLRPCLAWIAQEREQGRA